MKKNLEAEPYIIVITITYLAKTLAMAKEVEKRLVDALRQEMDGTMNVHYALKGPQEHD